MTKSVNEKKKVQFLSLIDYLFFLFYFFSFSIEIHTKKANVLKNYSSVTLEFFSLDINSSYEKRFLCQSQISDNKIPYDTIFFLLFVMIDISFN